MSMPLYIGHANLASEWRRAAMLERMRAMSAKRALRDAAGGQNNG
jgi:hypothetical protein